MVRRQAFGQGAEPKKRAEIVEIALNSLGKQPFLWPRLIMRKSLFNLFPTHGTVLRGADWPQTGNFPDTWNCQGWHMKILAESLSRPRLSVAMIVRDEQEVLAESIESVAQNRG